MAIRRAAKIDDNQNELVALIRAMGVSVAITSAAHDGFTDLVVGFGGITVLVEVKDGSKEPARRKLTPQQVAFHGSFKGAITVIENEQQAVELVSRIRQASAQTRIDWNMGARAYA
jgi:Holliday junction resolvase